MELENVHGPFPKRKKPYAFLRHVMNTAAFCAFSFPCIAAYEEIGLIISKSRASVIGTITSVQRNQGRHHVTNASIDFPVERGSQNLCHVTTWFRGTDSDIYVGAPITVVPATRACGTPWFADHIPPTAEFLEIAAVAALVAGSLRFFIRWESQWSLQEF